MKNMQLLLKVPMLSRLQMKKTTRKGREAILVYVIGLHDKVKVDKKMKWFWMIFEVLKCI